MRDLSRFRALLLASVALAAAVTLTACTPDGTTGDAQTPTPTQTPEPAFVLSDLLTAEVPSMCEHPACSLVDGVLPGIAELGGRVTLSPTLLQDIQSGADESDHAVIGTDAEGESFLAATLYCDRGGVSWPSQVLVWDADLTPVTAFHPEQLTGGDREQVAGITATDTGFSARWTAPNEFDAACCHQLSAESDVEVHVEAREMDVADPVLLRGEEQVRAVFQAGSTGATADGVEASADLYAGIGGIAEKGGEYDLDGIGCQDTESSPAGTLVCAVPVTIGGEQRSFIVYPTLGGGWNEYEVSAFELELW